MTDQAISFAGFKSPDKNYSELPHEFILLLPLFKSLAELKIVLYILRHTWGFHEYDEPKQITTDEFERGRKNRKGKRIDSGVGMVKNSILDGLQRAVDHGFIEVETDNSDKARIGKSYMLRMFKSCTSDGQTLNPGIPEVAPRTEKPTLETNQETKEIPLSLASLPTVSEPELELVDFLTMVQDKELATQHQPEVTKPFQEASEPKEKGSGEKEKVYAPPEGYARLYLSRQMDQESRSYTEHLILAGTNDPFPRCKRCGLVINDGTKSQAPAMNTVYVRCLGSEPKKARASPSKRKGTLPASYGDLFILIRRYCFNDADGQAIRGRVGKTTLALLRDYPYVTVEEFQRFADYWQAKANKPDFPCGTDTLPTNFGKWKANGNQASAGSDFYDSLTIKEGAFSAKPK